MNLIFDQNKCSTYVNLTNPRNDLYIYKLCGNTLFHGDPTIRSLVTTSEVAHTSHNKAGLRTTKDMMPYSYVSLYTTRLTIIGGKVSDSLSVVFFKGQ